MSARRIVVAWRRRIRFCGTWWGPALCLAGQCRTHCCQFLLLLRVDRRVCEIELLHRFHNRSRDNKARKPLVVSWHHEPWRVLRRGGANRFFVCAHVVAPKLTFVDVRSRELPVLLRCIEPLVPYALADQRMGYLLLLQDRLVHAHNQDLLVIGAVEYPDPPALG